MLSVSPEFLYNQKELGKAKALSNAIISDAHELEFSYENNMKIGYEYYYLNEPHRAEQYFNRAIKVASSAINKADAYYWSGQSLLKQNKIQAASQAFAQALNFNPNPSADFLFYYGIALYGINQYSDALNCFINYQEQVPQNKQAQELNLFIAAASVAKGDYDLAEQVLSNELEKPNLPFVTTATYLNGLNYFLTGRNTQALSALKRISNDTLDTKISTQAKLLIGEIYLETGDLKNAVDEFDDIIADNNNQYNDQAYFRSGISCLKLKQPGKAGQRFDSLISKYPDSPLLELAFYYKAKILDQSGRATRAKADYRKFLAMYPTRPLAEQVSFNLGLLVYNDENYLEAVDIFKDFLEKYPHSKYRADALFSVVQSYFRLGRYEQVKKYGEQFAQEFPQSNKLSELYYTLAETGIKRNDLNYAKKYYYRLGAGKYYPLALKGLADIYYQTDSLALSLNYYNRAENLSQDTLLDAVWYNRELVNLKQGGYSSYIDMLNHFLSKYPQSGKAAFAQYEIGKYYLDGKNYSGAITEFDKVYNYKPGSEIIPSTEMGKAESYRQIDNKAKAVESYYTIINNYSSFNEMPKALKSLADLYASGQQYDSAIVFYDRLITDYSKTTEAENSYLELAKIYRLFNRFDESIRLLEDFISRYPDSARSREAYLELADCYKEQSKFATAEKRINQMITKFGKSGDAYFKLAEIYLAQDNYSFAKTYYLNAQAYYYKEQKNELAALSLFEAAKCAMLIKDYKEAKELFNRCINLTQDERLRIECENQLRLILE